MLKCRIGEKTMYAVLLHERALMCDFPAYRTLNTTLTVATNAIDFSPPNITVEYYGELCLACRVPPTKPTCLTSRTRHMRAGSVLPRPRGSAATAAASSLPTGALLSG